MIILEYFQSNPKIYVKILSMMPLIVSTVKQCKRVMFLDIFLLLMLYIIIYLKNVFFCLWLLIS